MAKKPINPYEYYGDIPNSLMLDGVERSAPSNANGDTSSYLWGAGELLGLLGLLQDGYSNYEDINAADQERAAGWDMTKAQTDYTAGEMARQNAQQRANSAAAMYGSTGAGADVQAGAMEADQSRRAGMFQSQFNYQKAQNDRQQASLSRQQSRNTMNTVLGGIGTALGAANSMKENNWFGAVDTADYRGPQYRAKKGY
jgi:hypothetical protein